MTLAVSQTAQLPSALSAPIIAPMHTLAQIERDVSSCQRCPELRAYCAEVGRVKRRAFNDWDYWARPVPGFGDHDARLMILGLAPAPHGANRTGRMFTGDRSGDFLYAALHRAGFANQAEATDRDDGLALRSVYITAALRCAPPGNKPTSPQLHHCASWLDAEFEAIQPRVILCLGGIAWDAALRLLARHDYLIPRPKPRFGHAAERVLTPDEADRPHSSGAVRLLGCYHVSQQNTFTGRLTGEMIDAVLARANGHVSLD